MARPSTIENHPHRIAIESAIIEGQSQRQVAARFGLSQPAVSRHAKTLTSEIARAKHIREARKLTERDQLLADAMALRTMLIQTAREQDRISLMAYGEEGSLKVQISALGKKVDAAHKALDATLQVLKILGGAPDTQVNVQVNVAQSDEWVRIRTGLLRILDRHPEIRAEVIAMLERATNPPPLLTIDPDAGNPAAEQLDAR